MTTLGYFALSEEHPGSALVRHVAQAEQAGFTAACVSDHFHPWLEEQGQSPFVWSVLGAIASATERIRVQTAVTCPTIRTHPVVVAQAAATTAELFGARFALGVGSGEALNEHVLGTHWPSADVRLEMLEEALGLMRRMWQGDSVNHRGRHYTVENARLFTLPSEAPRVVVAAAGPKAAELAARVGDGLIMTSPDEDVVRRYRDAGGTGPVQAHLKVCVADDERKAVETAFRTWRSTVVPGQLSQDLPTPTHFAQASQLVTEDQVAGKITCGPDVSRHLDAVDAYRQVGVDEVYVAQVGPDQKSMLALYAQEILPRLAA